MGDHEDRAAGLWLDGDDRRVVVYVGGEMDIDRAPMLYDALRAAIVRPDGPGEVIVDVAVMSFCDSSGLNALIGARQIAEEHGKRLSLRAPRPQFRRLLEVTGVITLFHVTDT
ncbi:STAS domain-containing protein [Streptomyces sp. NPDC048507]|uniref:STAS domain-containing protein n=1 Tax=Streptomyces sp. NPDC048507 TaxID=3365560 RepID=UPI00371CDE2B